MCRVYNWDRVSLVNSKKVSRTICRSKVNLAWSCRSIALTVKSVGLHKGYIYGKKFSTPDPQHPLHIWLLWLSNNPDKFYLYQTTPILYRARLCWKYHLPETGRFCEIVISSCVIFRKYMLDHRQRFENTSQNVFWGSGSEDIFGSPRCECRSWRLQQ